VLTDGVVGEVRRWNDVLEGWEARDGLSRDAGVLLDVLEDTSLQSTKAIVAPGVVA
jgi:hypothetical protein